MLEEEAGFSGATDSTFNELHGLIEACNSSIDGTYDVLRDEPPRGRTNNVVSELV